MEEVEAAEAAGACSGAGSTDSGVVTSEMVRVKRGGRLAT